MIEVSGGKWLCWKFSRRFIQKSSSLFGSSSPFYTSLRIIYEEAKPVSEWYVLQLLISQHMHCWDWPRPSTVFSGSLSASFLPSLTVPPASSNIPISSFFDLRFFFSWSDANMWWHECSCCYLGVTHRPSWWLSSPKGSWNFRIRQKWGSLRWGSAGWACF